MKSNHLISVVIFFSFFLISCGTINGLKKPIAIIDAPPDLEVTNKKTGEKLVIRNARIGSGTAGNNRTDITYLAPAVSLKAQKNLTLEIKSKGISKTVDFQLKQNVGLLIFEGVLSLGIFTIIDLITGGHKTFKPPYIDVPAVFADKPQRTKKEMKRYIINNSQPVQ